MKYYLTEAGKLILRKTQEKARKRTEKNQEWAALSKHVKHKPTQQQQMDKVADKAQDLGVRG
tara:strand:+ start:830 stop:1015 length:186 start_codon:yes stop_codon:yes gene_type:complete